MKIGPLLRPRHAQKFIERLELRAVATSNSIGVGLERLSAAALAEEVARVVAPIVGQKNMDILMKSLKRMIPGVPKTALVDEKTYTATMGKMVSAGLFKETQPFGRAVDNSFGDAR